MQHPLSAWLEIFRASSDHRSFLDLARAPKFWIANHDALPASEQAAETLTPPMPYDKFLLGTGFNLRVEGKELDTRGLVALYVTNSQHRLGVEVSITLAGYHPTYLGAWHTNNFVPATTTLAELQLEKIEVISEADGLWDMSIDLFKSFLALLAAENVSVSAPPSTFSRKREQQRINTGKRVENYHIHHLTIKRSSGKERASGNGTRKRGHWRCAHLRHYKAGVGHIKTTKTVAIAPMFVGDAADTVHKDYIV